MSKRKTSFSEERPGKERDANRQRFEDVDSGLDFEDPFEDDYLEESASHEEEENGDPEPENKETRESEEEEEEECDDPEIEQEVWLPNLAVEKNVHLEHDETAYDMLHYIGTGWPCLSFEILPDSLGTHRSTFPHTVYMIAGTQAFEKKDNKVVMIKCSMLGKSKPETDSEASFDLDNDSSEEIEVDPIFETREFKHHDGTCNKIRVMPDHHNIVASFHENAIVQIYNLQEHMAALDFPPNKQLSKVKPIFTFNGHPTEGYGLAWNSKVPGRLISSDCFKNIFWWEPVEGGWVINNDPFVEHNGSVEDLQWSPSEADVFASCSVDRTIKLWDNRRGKQSVATINFHNNDVNVISWNHKRAFLLASGDDNGCFNVIDLRTLKDANTRPMFSFDWHKQPISSIEWNPNDDSGIALTSEDNSASLWDLSLSPEKTNLKGIEIPSQLMFIHQGQNEIKEIHWHKQIPGCLVTASNEGVNIFKPFNH